MAQEYKDRADPYSEAMKALHRAFGGEVELALEHLQPVADPREAIQAAEKAWERFQAQEEPLKKRGLSLEDLLWHQTVLRILPVSLEPKARWTRWVEEQRRAFSQAQANRPEGTIKKGKFLEKTEVSHASQTIGGP